MVGDDRTKANYRSARGGNWFEFVRTSLLWDRGPSSARRPNSLRVPGLRRSSRTPPAVSQTSAVAGIDASRDQAPDRIASRQARRRSLDASRCGGIEDHW